MPTCEMRFPSIQAAEAHRAELAAEYTAVVGDLAALKSQPDSPKRAALVRRQWEISPQLVAVRNWLKQARAAVGTFGNVNTKAEELARGVRDGINELSDICRAQAQTIATLRVENARLRLMAGVEPATTSEEH